MIASKLTLAGNTISKAISFGWILLLLTAFSLQAGRLKVDKIIFEGNHSFKTSTLKKILKTEEKKPFNNKLLRLDRTLLRNFYLNNGFLDVWVEASFKRRGEKITVTYRISEGRQYFLGGIQINGARLLTAEQARRVFKLKNGEVFRLQEIEDGLNRLEGYYFDHGKPYVVLDYEKSFRDSLVLITVRIKENETVYIRDIKYRGLEKVKRFIIRRELEIHKGEMYSRRKIEQSQRNIYSTGLFDYVGVQLEALDTTRSQVRLLIKVVEKKPRWVGFRFGVAYEQEVIYGGTFDITAEFGHRNLFGTARSVSVNVIPSFSYDFTRHNVINPKNQFSFTYIEPWIGYTRTPGVFRFSYLQVRPLNAADYNYFTSTFQVRHDFTRNWQATATLAYNQVRILEQDTLSESYFSQTKGQDFIYSISGRVAQDKRDNYLNTQEGFLMELNVKFAYSRSRSEHTGEISINRFFKFIVQWNRYQKFPLQKHWVLASRLRGGNIVELGKLAQIPVLERFYLGGASTVRGYPEQLLGPVARDEQGNLRALGGKLMLLGNLEVRIPLFWLFWGELFFDAGNVWAENQDFRLLDIKPSSGAGLALVTPVGPIRFDYGVKLRPEKGESPGEFHISISFAF